MLKECKSEHIRSLIWLLVRLAEDLHAKKAGFRICRQQSISQNLVCALSRFLRAKTLQCSEVHCFTAVLLAKTKISI